MVGSSIVLHLKKVMLFTIERFFKINDYKLELFKARKIIFMKKSLHECLIEVFLGYFEEIINPTVDPKHFFI